MAGKTKKTKSPVTPSTQRFLDIAEIREDALVTKTGGLRAVFLVSSVNFALKSEEEQNAIIGSYVRFLNSINFPIEIVIQSRRLVLDRYLANLENLRREQPNELLRLQMGEYLSFVRELLELGDIMTKRFFVVVPLEPVSVKQSRGFLYELKKLLHPGEIIRYDRKRFAELKEALEKRAGFASSGIASIGLRVQRLDTQGLIELAYASYNPHLARLEPLPSLEQIQVVTE